MARDIDLADLFEDDGIDEAALVRVAARFDPKDYDDLSNPSVMQTFYRRLFPAKQLFTWLNHDHVPTKQWTHREIAFTLANDAYLRYNSFASHVDFHREVIRLNPARFEIGAIYNARPKDKRLQLKQALKPVQRELVFDIDMTDYDEIRTCCQGKGICTRCWKFIACAVKILNRALREDFGFQHLMWVYSGRRGIHCWISDASALNLSDEQRKSIVGYLEVIKGGAAQQKKVELFRPLHPFLRTCVEQLNEPFHQVILDDQDCFRSQAGWQALLQLIPTNEEKLVQLRDSLQNEWQNSPAMSSRDRWQTLIERGRDKIAEERADQRRRIAGERLQAALEDIKLQYLYARIDAEVSKHQNHLLKSPFVVHPGTGRVCVPVDPDRVDDFDPERVPTVGLLLRELDKAALQGKKDQEGSAIEPTWEHTSLKPYIDMFDKHIAAIVKDSVRSRRAAKAETFDF